MKSKILALMLAVLLVANNSNAQDEPPKFQSGGIQKRAIILANPQDGDSAAAVQFQSIRLSGDLTGGDGAMWSFSTGGPESMIHGFPGGGGNGSGLMNLLHNKSIRDEIELVDDQYKKMQDFYKARQDKIMKEVDALIQPALSGDSKKGNSSVKLRGKKLQELIKKQQEDADAELNDLLLPHQRKRLEEVGLRMRLKNMGTVRAITQNPTKEKLGISDDVEKKLKKKEAELKKEFEEEVAKLREKHKKELLNVLPAKTRRKLDDLMGDDFEYKQTDWRSRVKQMESRIQKKEKE